MSYVCSKAHLDQILAQAKMEVLPTSKLWEGYRAYEKRLTASKDKSMFIQFFRNDVFTSFSTASEKAKRGPRKTHKSAEAITSDDDDEVAPEEAPPEPERPRPKPRPKRKAAQRASEEPEQAAPEHEEQPPSEPEPEAGPATPRQRSQPLTQSESPALLNWDPSPGVAPGTSPDAFATPSAARKRARSPDDDEVDDPMDETESRLSEPPESPAPPNASQETHTSELQIRRKRVRH